MKSVYIYIALFVGAVALNAQSNHTITIDGNNDFNVSQERFVTSSGTALYSYVTWDRNYLYIGLSGSSVNGLITDNDRNYHLYIDTDPNKVSTQGTGTTSGEAWRYTPVLPFSANYHYVFKTADNTEYRKVYSGSAWSDANFSTQNWKNNGYWELKISLADLGAPSQMNLLLYVEEDWSGGNICGGTPSGLFNNTGTGGNITFSSHWINFSLLDQTIPNLSYNNDNYSWLIRVKAQTSTLADSSGYAGMSLKASNGIDTNVDLAKPPTPPSNYVEVFFPHSTWQTALGPNFMRDIKQLISLDSTTSIWNFTVRTDKTNTPVTVTADQFGGVPSNYAIRLKDLSNDSTHDVRARGSYVFQSGAGGDRLFNLIVGVSLSSPAISSSTSSVNFGTVKVGKDTTVSLVISNAGDSTLVVSNIVSSQSVFTFTGGTSYSIKKNSSVTIPVKFSPSAALVFGGTLKIYSNDWRNSVLTVNLTGTGQVLTPHISTSTGSLAFGNVKVDFDSISTFKIYNTGDTTLNISGMTTLNGKFKVVSASVLPVLKNDSATVQLRFRPYDINPAIDTLTIVCNDPLKPSMKISLTGTGIPATLSTTFSRGWNLVSVPITQVNPSTGAVIGDNLTNFVLYAYGSSGTYTNADSVLAGRGYWLGLESPGTVDVNGIPKTTLHTQNFQAGWNLVSSPFVRKYAKKNVQFKRGVSTVGADSAFSLGWIQNNYFTYRQSDSSYTLSDSLVSWSGYWLAALKDSLQIVFNHDSAGVVGKALVPETTLADLNNWQFTIRASMNGRKDNLLTVGVSQYATDNFDPKYDMVKPPAAPAPGSIETYFRNTNWSPYFTKYASDIRASFVSPAPGKQWEFSVVSQQTGILQLSWDNLLSIIPLPLRLKYAFILSGQGLSGQVNLLQANSVNVAVTAGQTSTFYINADVTSTVPENKPYSFALYQNYPNPFNPAAVIGFELPAGGYTALKVYDILGNEVKTLVNGYMESGYHSVVFSASGLASGTYIYKLSQGANTQARKLVYQK